MNPFRRGVSWKTRVLVALPVVVLLALGAGTAALYAYDRAQADRIRTGITVDRVEIGGLSVDQARAKLARALLPRYRRTLVVVDGRRRFRLTAGAVGLRVDLERVLTTARLMSRRGNFLQRGYRELRRTPLHVNLIPRIQYSPEAVVAFVHKIQRKTAVEPRNARFVSSLTKPKVRHSRSGRLVRVARLQAAIGSRLLHPAAPRTVALATRRIVPKVTTKTLEHKYSTLITVSRGERRLRLFKHLRLAKTYVIAVGQIGLETPAGLYGIQTKQVDPSWHVPKSPWAGDLAGRVIPPGPEDPLKARWMGFFDGAGIHGTDNLSSLGTAASHGCIRMSIPDVIQLYDVVPLHAPILIE